MKQMQEAVQHFYPSNGDALEILEFHGKVVVKQHVLTSFNIFQHV
jgi:hypothetical protein